MGTLLAVQTWAGVRLHSQHSRIKLDKPIFPTCQLQTLHVPLTLTFFPSLWTAAVFIPSILFVSPYFILLLSKALSFYPFLYFFNFQIDFCVYTDISYKHGHTYIHVYTSVDKRIQMRRQCWVTSDVLHLTFWYTVSLDIVTSLSWLSGQLLPGILLTLPNTRATGTCFHAWLLHGC